MNEPGLRDTIDAELADLLEKGGGDHFYGSWRGDGKGSGGRPVLRSEAGTSWPPKPASMGVVSPHAEHIAGVGRALAAKGPMFSGKKQEKALAKGARKAKESRVAAERAAMTDWLRKTGLTAEQHARYLGHSLFGDSKMALTMALAGG